MVISRPPQRAGAGAAARLLLIWTMSLSVTSMVLAACRTRSWEICDCLRLERWRILGALHLDLDPRVVDHDQLVALGLCELGGALAHGAVHSLPLEALLAVELELLHHLPLLALQALESQRVELALLVGPLAHRLDFLAHRLELADARLGLVGDAALEVADLHVPLGRLVEAVEDGRHVHDAHRGGGRGERVGTDGLGATSEEPDAADGGAQGEGDERRGAGRSVVGRSGHGSSALGADAGRGLYGRTQGAC
jgi:hypothetical protein